MQHLPWICLIPGYILAPVDHHDLWLYNPMLQKLTMSRSSTGQRCFRLANYSEYPCSRIPLLCNLLLYIKPSDNCTHLCDFPFCDWLLDNSWIMVEDSAICQGWYEWWVAVSIANFLRFSCACISPAFHVNDGIQFGRLPFYCPGSIYVLKIMNVPKWMNVSTQLKMKLYIFFWILFIIYW
jgi:hypothetical protein